MSFSKISLFYFFQDHYEPKWSDDISHTTAQFILCTIGFEMGNLHRNAQKSCKKEVTNKISGIGSTHIIAISLLNPMIS